MTLKLDAYEQDIEDNFEFQESTNDPHVFEAFKQAAERHVKKKRPITLRVAEYDLEAMKIKASKLGIPYQTYINILIHQDAAKLDGF